MAPYFQPTRTPLQSHPTFLLSPAHWETDGYGGENKGASPGASRSASVSPYGKGEGAGQEDLSCRCSPRCQAQPPSLLCWPQAAPKGHRPLAEPLVLPAGRPVSGAHGCGRKGGDVWTGMCPPTRLWLSPAPCCKPSVLPQDAAGARGRCAAHGPGTGQPACAWKGRLTDTCPGGSPAAAASKSSHGQVRVATG